MSYHVDLPSGAPLNYLQLGFLFLSFLASYSFFRTIYFLYFHPLASFRGPRWAAMSTWWLYSVSNPGRAEQIFEKLHRKYSKYNSIRCPASLIVIQSDRDTGPSNRPQRASYIRLDSLSHHIFPRSCLCETCILLRRLLNTSLRLPGNRPKLASAKSEEA